MTERGGKGWPHAAAVVAALGTLAASPCAAGEVELTLGAGRTAPRYEQVFRYQPALVVPPLPGVSVAQEGGFRLDAQGGPALSAALAWQAAGPLGIEGRLDLLDAEVVATGARYRLSVTPPAPLPAFATEVDLGSGAIDLERAKPLSLNLRLRAPGPVRLVVSGGVSYLGTLRARGRQRVALGPLRPLGFAGPIEIAAVDLVAEAAPADAERDRFGWNAGAGVQIGLGAHLALAADVRAFRFRERTLRWRAAGTRPLGPLEEQLQAELLRRLDPIDFEPTFYLATAGVSLRF